ncbi:hypothetical protein OA258_02030 [Pelagibacteraceae bacterium]|nr:hypothetical protein [Pelagibacteraceae bacterium]
MISFLVRDKNWNNYDPKILNYEENFDSSLEYIFDLEYGIAEILKTRNTILFSENSITLSSEGEFLTEFWTNRIGFNLLIPLQNHVGSNIIVSKETGVKEEKKFPVFITPDQPILKFKKLAYTLGDSLLVNINFEGILFEMEDQRNWGDASYKIYSGSLLDPFPYLEKEGSNFSQTVKIDLVNKKQRSFPSKNIVNIDNSISYKFPKIGIKIDSPILPDDNLINNFDYYYYLIDFTKDFTNVTLRSQNKVFLVALVDHINDPAKELTKIYNFITENTINLDKILICPKIYLNSFQPAGEWPKAPELNEYYKIAKKMFSHSQIVTGMVTNFTELNRKRPKVFYDLVSFSFTPIVHDSSDFGVLNTPETIPYIFKTLKKFSNSCDVHIGPISIGMHFNPYGESLVNNKKKIRLEMADSDPRHDELFSLTWTLAIFIQSINKESKYFTFNSIYGHHGILNKDNTKRPLYHLNNFLISLSNSEIFKFNPINEVYGLKIVLNDKKYYLFVNSSKQKKEINISELNFSYQYKLNLKNYTDIFNNNFSFFNFKKDTNPYTFEPLEIKFIEDK